MLNEDLVAFWNDKWDKVKTDIWPTEFGSKVSDFFEKNNLSYSWKNVLDVWCWVWRDSLYFSREKDVLQVTAQDPSKWALQKITSFANEQGLKNIDFHHIDILHDELKGGEYDIIHACNSLHYFRLEDMERIVAKLQGVLKLWWIFCVRVKSTDDSKYWEGEEIEANYYRQWRDTKYFFTTEIIGKLFEDFDIILLEEQFDKQELIDWTSRENCFIDFIWIKK